MRYQIDSIHVSHERLNDEVIIINAVSGAYYSGTGSFADLWDMLMAGASAAEIADELAAQYAADASLILPDILAAIAALQQSGLLREAPERGAPDSLSLPNVSRAIWAAPSFAEYTDMWDLIQLDPIHEVSEAGWPFAPAETKI